MSLLRLLTTGKSLVSAQDTESRYRLSTQRLLPQFGPAKNPFSSKAETDRAPAAAIPQGAEAGMTTPKTGTQSLARTLWFRTVARWSGWMPKLSGLFARRRVVAGKPAIPQFSKPPVQGELSLDRVKVVRNDLSEADLEVVPARLKAAPTPMAVEPAGSAASAWGRVTTRIFHAGRR
jgi:hypothetical protein